jgi:hypothetical protein
MLSHVSRASEWTSHKVLKRRDSEFHRRRPSGRELKSSLAICLAQIEPAAGMRPDQNVELQEQLVKLAYQKRRFGYRRLHRCLNATVRQ